jgi:hypothetical protein
MTLKSPNVNNRSQAAVIKIVEGKKLLNINFRLPKKKA